MHEIDGRRNFTGIVRETCWRKLYEITAGDCHENLYEFVTVGDIVGVLLEILLEKSTRINETDAGE